MSAEKIPAEKRTEFGKGAARRIRRADKVPAVVYGHGNEPLHITLPGHETWLALKNGGANALLEVSLEGETRLALTKQVQIDPIKRTIEHVDLVTVTRGEKVHVDVPVEVVGEAVRGSLVTVEHATLSLEAEATHIPETVEVSIEGVEMGTQIHASELTLPKGTSLLTDGDALVVNITAAPTTEQVEAELADAEADAGIDRPEAETETEAETPDEESASE